MLFSYHTHCEFCDGRASASIMAAAAYKAGYSILGFSSHGPLPFNTSWNLKWPRIHDYEKTIRDLSAEWAPRGMDIMLGLEIDYIENQASPKDAAYDVIALDFKIGSTHYITGLPGRAFTVDETAEAFERHVMVNAGGDASLIWKEYYERLIAMMEKGGFDIIGHFDLVKKNNSGGRWFDEGSRAYTDSAFAAVDRAA
ncbi:MAG TPA: PHP domain-containing protein, partial [Rectinemataceae bacterium]|nr:PHP domain-containing protein [Rectinemataceae bacterium]